MSDPSVSLTAAPSTQKKIAGDRKRFQSRGEAQGSTMILDAEGTIQRITPAARRLLEYRHDDELMPCFFSHVHGRNMYQVMRDVADMVCYGKPKASWMLRMRTGKGRWQWIRATVINRLSDERAAIEVILSDLQDT